MIRTDPKDLTIRRKVTAVEFGLYTDQDVRDRSVVEITSSQAYLPGTDTPLPGGLYDPKMGCMNAFDKLPCPTCAGRFLTCPGHFGHVELCVPLYQPLLFGDLVKCLRAKCFHCHHLRIPKSAGLIAQAKLLLLLHHRLYDYHNLDGILANLARQGASQTFADDPEAQSITSKAQRTHAAAQAVEGHCHQVIAELGHKPPPQQTSTAQLSLLREFRKLLVKEWMATPKCHRCGAISPRLKQDQSNKIFQLALSQKSKQYNASENIDALPSAIDVLAERGNNKNADNNEDGGGYDSEDTDPGERRRQRRSGGHAMIDDEAEEVPAGEESDDDMEEDNDQDDEEYKDDGDAARSKKKKAVTTTSEDTNQFYMHPGEVQAQCQLLWERSGPLMTLLWFGWIGGKNAKDLVALQKQSFQRFFCMTVAVPPSRFRPPMTTNGMTVEHAQNGYLSKVIAQNAQVRQYLYTHKDERMAHTVWIQLQTDLNTFMDSSKDPNAKSASLAANLAPGIRQLLERKEGIFRQHMMGKRVDSACRSVISPDPYVGTNEIGIPLAFAQVLTYPTPVTEWNVTELRKLVERGPHEYPGAKWVEWQGHRMDLSRMTLAKRQALGAMLLTTDTAHKKPTIVGRQLRHGDTMLVNRQPTLHKPGIMAHQVRILHDPNQKTIRMHYANCNTYNADFDGDEMNCHFPQSDVGRAEAMYIASTDLQYIVPTDGSPLRGLIQDHVDGGVKLTKRDTFLKRWEYQQLLFAALASLPRLEVLEDDQDIQLLPPAIMKPEPLWTGKQVITTLLLHLCNSPRGKKHANTAGEERSNNMLSGGGLSLERKSKVPASAFGVEQEEHLVIIRDGELLRGVLDKSAFGSTDFSMVHGIYEAYGPQKAGLLLNSLGRLFTAYIQYYAGHSCRVEDLVLTKESDEARRGLVERAYNVGSRACKAWADAEGGKVPIEPVSEKANANTPLKPVEVAAASAKLGELLGGTQGKENFAALDGYMMSQLNPLASEIVKKCLPDGLAVPFPANTFSLMTTTGAKGSIVNQSQVSCALGQQALEGRRVPRMNSGRTLPSFAPYDLNPRADGFVMDRFLTGVRPQEYYFHCMAGREGLVDTAVKTSRSGYLQRCLVKHLEELKVCYDFTVRNGEGGVVQFLYGEDALDPTKASYMDCTSRSFEFMARNHKSFHSLNNPLPRSTIDLAAEDAKLSVSLEKLSLDDDKYPLNKGDLIVARKLRSGSQWTRGALCRGWHDAVIMKKHGDGTFDIQYVKDRDVAKRVKRVIDLGRCGSTNTPAQSSRCVLIKPSVADPIISSSARSDGKEYRLGVNGACVSERVASAASRALSETQFRSAMKAVNLTRDKVGNLIAAKYANALCAPGEAVGSIAAQSVGEPSTQMTLNTFHLAGAGANVTLGIPRLREIIMTASKELKTPTMSVPLRDSVSDKAATRLMRSFTKLTLIELIAGFRGITVRETLTKDSIGEWKRAYYVILKLHPAERIATAFGLTLKEIASAVGKVFTPLLEKMMTLELRRSKTDGDIGSYQVQGGSSSDLVEETGKTSDGSDDARMTDKDESAPNKDAMDEDLTDKEDESDDEGGEEDGADAARYRRSKDNEVSYGAPDDDDDADGPSSSLRDDLVSEGDTVDQPETTPSTPVDTSFTGGVKVDTKKNLIVLEPLYVSPAVRPLLMVGLVEKAAERTLVLSKKKIDEAFINKEDNGRGRCLQTAGVNFGTLWELDESIVDHNRLMSNDTWAVCCTYGVEAARYNIVDQIRSVFGAYGIEVDPRHLSLIADYMTYEGGYKPMNRRGMEEMSSTLLQMSFETTTNFMTGAALTGKKDLMESPSANIVLGRPIKHGTGAFDLLVKSSA